MMEDSAELYARITDFFAAESSERYLLLCGGAARVLRLLPAESVHTCMTSPPYWSQREYSGPSDLGNESRVEEYVERLVLILDQVWRVLRSDGSLWLNLGDTYQRKNLAGVPWRVAIVLQEQGWMLRNAIVWDKMKGNPCNARDKLRNVYEFIFHLVKQERYYYDLNAIRNPPGRPHRRKGRIVTPTGVSGVKYEQQIRSSTELSDEEKTAALQALAEALRKVETGEMPDFRMIIRGTQRATHSDSTRYSGRADELRKRGFCILPYHKRGTKPGDVWRIIPEDRWRSDGHFAVYPVELCEIPIKATCPPDGIILDPFVGTGTTIVAALQLHRKAVGIDTSAEYLQVAHERIAEVARETAHYNLELPLGWK
jgi:DNA modification methylase